MKIFFNIIQYTHILSQLSANDILAFELTAKDNKNIATSRVEKLNQPKNENDLFLPILHNWFFVADLSLVLARFETLPLQECKAIKEWIHRLEKTRDYQKNQTQLVHIVCNILETVLEDKEFKVYFIKQLEKNNANSEDDAALALSEIYASWRILTFNLDNCSIDEKNIIKEFFYSLNFYSKNSK